MREEEDEKETDEKKKSNRESHRVFVMITRVPRYPPD